MPNTRSHALQPLPWRCFGRFMVLLLGGLGVFSCSENIEPALPTDGNIAYVNFANLGEAFLYDTLYLNNYVYACTLYVPAESINPAASGYIEENDYSIYDLWKDFMPNIKAIGSDAREQTINGIADAVTGEVNATIELAATATSGQAVTYARADNTVAMLEGHTLTILKEGETTLTVSQAGDGINWSPVSKEVKVSGVSYAWLEIATIAVEENTVKVRGPGADKFTKIFVNGTEGNDLSDVTGTVELKATTADGSEVVKLKIQK